MMEISEDGDSRELWFIYSPFNKPWANLRIATFTKAINAPHLDLVIIHNEAPPRIGMRVWDEITASEGWFKVRQIEVPTLKDVMEVVMREQIIP
jgi:hypothetical protein